MPVDNRRAILKTALLAPGGTLMSWGAQMLVDGDPATGGVGMVLGLAFFAGFVLIEEYDIPYESEILELLASQDTEAVVEAGKEASEQAGDEYDGGM